jgi:dephospho-CoA kinase
VFVGLTGGTGSGKTAVAERLAARGALVIDADRLAREVVAPGTPGLAAVVAEFGDRVLGPDGSLDRPALGRLVFADPAARARLEAIVHPLVRERTAAAVQAAPPGAVVVHDVPLLVETGAADSYDAVVVVTATPETQIARLVASRGLDPGEARSRLAAQARPEDRLAVADFVIRNDGSLADLDRRVDALWAWLLDKGPRPATADG